MEEEEEMGNYHPNTPLMSRRDYFASYYAPSSLSSCVNNEEEHHNVMKGNYISNYDEINYVVSNNNNAQYCCYSLLEAMPLPGPTWSATAPSLLAEKKPSKPNIEELASLVVEEEKKGSGENQGDSSWRLGFLEGLDDGNCVDSEKLILDHTFVENNNVGVDEDYSSSNEVLISNESLPYVDGMDDLGYCLDDWLMMIPTMDKDLGDFVIP